jgi:hypothetical protein
MFSSRIRRFCGFPPDRIRPLPKSLPIETVWEVSLDVSLDSDLLSIDIADDVAAR